MQNLIEVFENPKYKDDIKKTLLEGLETARYASPVPTIRYAYVMFVDENSPCQMCCCEELKYKQNEVEKFKEKILDFYKTLLDMEVKEDEVSIFMVDFNKLHKDIEKSWDYIYSCMKDYTKLSNVIKFAAQNVWN